MQDIKIGDKVIHLLTKEEMVVKRINGDIITLEKTNPKPFMLMGIEYAGNIAVCNVNNLTKI